MEKPGSPDWDVLLSTVSKQYDEHLAVADLTLGIRPGEFFSLLGPSGCGKTTTLRMIAGFERPTSGSITIRGRLSNDIPPYRRHTNMVFQQLALFPHLDVFANIAFGLRMRHTPATEIAERVRSVLRLVSLDGFERRAVRSLSGGQQQRVAIARALVNEPAVLLLDEPLGALDLRLRVQMQRELKDLQRRLRTTFIYVTHDQTEALSMSDRIGVMNDGRLEQVGTSREIYETPATPFVATFIGDTNLLKLFQREAGRFATDDESIVAYITSRDASILVSLRPERIRLGASSQGAQHTALGQVIDSVYVGPDALYTVRVAQTDLMVKARSDRLLSVGTEVSIGWQQSDLVHVKQPSAVQSMQPEP